MTLSFACVSQLLQPHNTWLKKRKKKLVHYVTFAISRTRHYSVSSWKYCSVESVFTNTFTQITGLIGCLCSELCVCVNSGEEDVCAGEQLARAHSSAGQSRASLDSHSP